MNAGLGFVYAGCSTCVSRVQFGVPPNCIGAPVSGETPETTRQRRVLPTANKHLIRA
jgi:hypothetical protein